jgi:hypothetical protein
VEGPRRDQIVFGKELVVQARPLHNRARRRAGLSAGSLLALPSASVGEGRDVAELLLDGTPVGPIRGEEAREFGWDDLHRAYAERLSITPGETASD